MSDHECISSQTATKVYIFLEPAPKKDMLEYLFDLISYPKFAEPDHAKKTEPYVDVGFVCENTEAYDNGFYLFSKQEKKILLMQQGNYQKIMAHICLDQK
jgi:hypothetical protein